MLKREISPGIDIKELELRHVNEFYAFIEKGRINFENWIPFVSTTTSLELAEKKIEIYLGMVMTGKGYFWCLWKDNKIIGLILIKDIDEKARTAEIGYMVDKEFEGKGLIRESCKLMIEFIFSELKMNKIVLCCDENNIKSIGIAKRFNFELEGILKQNISINGKNRNTMCWALFWDNGLK